MIKLILHRFRCFREGIPVFPRLTLSISSREALVCAGANGAGKTTLLRAFMGLCPYDGQLLWNDQPVPNLQAQAVHMSVRGGLRGDLTVLQHVHFWQLFWPVEEGTLAEHLGHLRLIPFKNRLVRTLSSGERQRLKFLPLLLQKKPLWLLDEPFTHLDEEGQLIFESLMDRHLLEGGMALLTKPSRTKEGLRFLSWHRDLMRAAS